MIQKNIGLLIALSLFLTFGASSAMAMTDAELVSSMNQGRVEQGLTKFATNAKLEKAAHAKLLDMQNYKYWSHNNPVTGELWWKNIYKAGVKGRAAENLARGYSDSNTVVGGWISSPAHKANMFNSIYKKVGVAVGEVEYPEGKKTVVIAEFGE